MVYRIGAIVCGLGLVYLGISGALEREIQEKPGEALPVLGQVQIAPGLVNGDGNPFVLTRGKVWIANFVFSSCPAVCPRLTRWMGAMEKQTRGEGDRLRFVSFSVDPETDTPARLRAFAADFGANPSRWSFVTGLRSSVEKTLTESFFVGMGDAKSGSLVHIAHSEKFALVDANQQLRGLFSVQTEEERARLLRQAKELAQATVAE